MEWNSLRLQVASYVTQIITASQVLRGRFAE